MRQWQALQLTPLDTLFFREPRPFTAGEQTDARSLFPPTPLTLQGMVRSLILAHHAPDALARRGALPPAVEAVIGTIGGAVGTLRVHGPWLLARGQWLLPAPMDLIMPASEDGATVTQGHALVPSGPASVGRGSSSLPGKLRPLVPPEGWNEFTAVNGWLTWTAFRQYLEGRPVRLERRVTWFQPSDLFVEEPRSGVGMEARANRAKEGLLYFPRHVRLLTDVGLGIEIAGLGALAAPWRTATLAALGGEGKAVVVRETAAPPWRTDTLECPGRMKMVLTQPAWFAAGWYPAWMDPATGTATLDGSVCTWVAARVERPVRIGGWNLARRRPKPLRAFVPAGSIYYLEGAGLDQWRGVWDASVTENPNVTEEDTPETFDQIGFGHALAGRWNTPED